MCGNERGRHCCRKVYCQAIPLHSRRPRRAARASSIGIFSTAAPRAGSGGKEGSDASAGGRGRRTGDLNSATPARLPGRGWVAAGAASPAALWRGCRASSAGGTRSGQQVRDIRWAAARPSTRPILGRRRMGRRRPILRSGRRLQLQGDENLANPKDERTSKKGSI